MLQVGRVIDRWTCLAALLALAMMGVARGQNALIGIQLVGPPGPVVVGQTIDIKVRLKREPIDSMLPTGFSCAALDLIFAWNPAHLQLTGLSQAGSVPLLASYFPNPSVDYTGINEVVPPQDGNGLYYALAPLGQPVQVPVQGVQITTFKFKVLSAFAETWVEFLSDLTVNFPAETVVYDGTVAGLDVTGTFTHAQVTQVLPCPADLDGNWVVNGADLAIVLGVWGPAPGSPADLNQDGVVNGADLAIVLGAWGSCPGS